eukprot:m.224516 g.224516  ORF g.224516 m.224516 type:complete len:188 (-) comp13852_c5_seq1:148-711(-)
MDINQGFLDKADEFIFNNTSSSCEEQYATTISSFPQPPNKKPKDSKDSKQKEANGEDKTGKGIAKEGEDCDNDQQQVSKHIGKKFCVGLAEFGFKEETGLTWDLVWVQWCAIYLKDDEFISFFREATQSVTSPHGLVVLKENVLRGDSRPEYDKDDKSVTRSDAHMRRLWEGWCRSCGLRTAERLSL